MDQSSKDRFLRILRETLNVSEAAKGAGFHRITFYRHRESDPEFAKAWDDACEEAYDELEAEARRRAFKGVDEPVFHRGEIVGHIRRYSDSLVMPLLGTYRRKFRPQTALELTGADGGPVQIDDATAAGKIAAILNAARERKDLLGE